MMKYNNAYRRRVFANRGRVLLPGYNLYSLMSPTAPRHKGQTVTTASPMLAKNTTARNIFPDQEVELNVAEEVELNTIVTFCGFIVAFAALSYSGTTDPFKKNVIVGAALVAILYTFVIIFLHLHQRKRQPIIFYCLALGSLGTIAAYSFEREGKEAAE